MTTSLFIEERTIKTDITMENLRKIVIVLIFLAFLLPNVYAQSVEPVVVRTVAYNSVNHEYTFNCAIPQGANPSRHWNIREDHNPNSLYSITTTNSNITFAMPESKLYHIGCEVFNQSNQLIRGDFHLNRRTSLEANYPNIIMTQTNGKSFTSQCVQNISTNSNLYWFLNSAYGNFDLSQFNNQQTISYTLPQAGLWDIVCGVWDNNAQRWHQGGLPVEFFNSGPAYVPNFYGCVPGQPCYINSTQNNNQTNSTQCFNSVQNIPASCTGGQITQDSWNGCRSVACSSTGKSLQILACNKPDLETRYFEIYRQSSTGTGLQICLGTSCIGSEGSGFTQSTNFPMCLKNQTRPNSPPLPPVWLEPNQNSNDVHPADFHLQVFAMSDPDGDRHVSSDFEIWDISADQRVWVDNEETVVPTHVHNADGVFENNLAGRTELLFNKDYRARARFYSDSLTNSISNWSEWRNFRTLNQTSNEVNGTNFIWKAAPGYTIDLIASNISMPVNIQTAPNIYTHISENQRPILYVTQLYGQLGMIRKNGQYVQYANNLLNYNAFGSLPGAGETGVTGLYVDGNTGDLFVSMVYNTPSGFKGKVDRYITNDNGDGYTSIVNVLNNIPVAPSHQVQSITRGPDGKLYLNTGDANNLSAPTSTSNLAGKVLRFNDDGSMPSDNPIANSYIYALGFRNPFGAAWRPNTNNLFVSENGPDEDDAIKRITPGGQHGWCCNTTQSSWQHYERTVAPTQIVFNSGQNNFPSNTNGNLYIALSGATYSLGPDSYGKKISEYSFTSNGDRLAEKVLVNYTGNGRGAPIGLAFGSDGLYFTDIYGEQGFVGVGVTKGNIFRIRPGVQTGPPTPPIQEGLSATIAQAPWYPQGLNMVWYCNAQGGSNNYRYDFHFGDDEHQYNSESNNVYHSYRSNGTYIASCTVNDLTANTKANSPPTTLVLGTPINNTIPPSTTLNLSIAPWYPQGTHYIFNCVANGYNPTQYVWSFGDSHNQQTTSSDVYHIYSGPGNYLVQCIASNSATSRQSNLTIEVR